MGFRFDPCFTEGAGTQTCRRQVRIIWQPIVEQKGIPVTLDAPVHTFYEFDDTKWNSLIGLYAKLIAANPVAKPETSLGVNPRAARQGYGGAFLTGLKKLILDNCGSANLVRLTLMSLHPGDNEWHFMGFNIEAGKILPIAIANVGSTVQILKTAKPIGFDLLATVQPDGNSQTASAVYKDSLTAKAKLTEGEMRNFADELLKIENPLRSNPGTVDCAGCHMAGPGAQWARLNFPQWEWQNLAIRSGWVTKRDVTNTTLKFLKPRRFRACGFFYADPVISQRTINESAVVADSLDQSHPLAK